MGACRAHGPTGQARRPQAHDRRARDFERNFLRAVDRLPMAGAAKRLPPKSTVWAYFDLWTWDGTLEHIHHALYVAVREQAGREASPTTAIIDSQSAKGAQKGGPCSTRRASMRARRSWVASAISSSIRSASC